MIRQIFMMNIMLLLAGCQSGPTALIHEASNATSQLLCSAAFVSKIDPERAYQSELRPESGMGLIDWASRRSVNMIAKEATTTILGGSKSRSVYREGRGCTLIHAETTIPEAIAPVPITPALLPDIAGPQRVQPPSPALQKAITVAFAEPATGAPRATQAIVIVHKGRIIGEHYAEGIGPETPLNGHSLAKSVTNALIGILVKDGKLSVSDKLQAPEWNAAGDARAAITVDQLLRMSAGFDFDEGKGAGIASHIWYSKDDIAHEAALLPLATRPGTTWHYSSGSYSILSRLIKDKVGNPQSTYQFVQTRLFAPLGIQNATLTFDGAGTMMGAQAIYAPARDWAKFGLLYLHDGKVGPHRILPENWVSYSTTPTAQSGYGAGFWLNNVRGRVPNWGFPWGLASTPNDAFMARGYMGQWIIIIPSCDLVIIRMGNSHDDAGARGSVDRLVNDVIAAIKH